MRRKEKITLSAEEQAEFDHEEDDEEGAAHPSEDVSLRSRER